MSTELKDRPRTGEPGTEREDRMAHIVYPAEAVTKAYIEGTPCTALCGYVWVPSRDPENYPTCQACEDILNGGDGDNDFEG